MANDVSEEMSGTSTAHALDKGVERSSSANGSKEKESTNIVPFYKLFSFADSVDVMLMIFGIIGSVGNGLSMPLMVVLYGELADSFGQNQDKTNVVQVVSKVSLKFVYLGVGTGIASFLQVACWIVTGERQASRIRKLYLQNILRQDVTFFDMETNTGEVIGRMSGDTVLIQDAMGEKVGKFIQMMTSFVGGYFVAFFKGWLLTLVLMSSIPPIVMAGGMVSHVSSKMSTRAQDGYTRAATIVEQTIGSIRTVASFTGERQAVVNYNKSLTKAYRSGVHEGFASGLGLGTVMSVAFCGFAMAVWFGAKLVIDKGYSGGTVITVIIAVLNGAMSLGQAFPCISAFAAGRAAAFKMFETINRRPDIDPYDTQGKKLDDIQGDIELRDVHFCYPARPDEQIFSGFSLAIPSGTTAALVGQSGSGKSTVISLIERFYDPQGGEVLIDGTNLKEFQLKWIREKIGLVSQEPVLFSSSIKDNIAYGKDGATVEEIRAACELANAAKFIDKLPQGLNTMVGDHGTQLSGGQKQRVAIARAILKDPRILLLDEATSALDAESERIVQEALDRIMVNRTTVIVAHRLSTVINADMIAVIHLGKMVEKGSHVELLENTEGPYSQLVKLQGVSNKGVGDREKTDIGTGSGRASSQRMYSSISRVSSSVGNSSSRRSLTLSFRLPTGLTEITIGEPEPKPEPEPEPKDLNQKTSQEVPLRRIAYLNKPEIPILCLGSLAAIINGVTYPIFSVLIARTVKVLYEPPHELSKDSKFWALMFVALGMASFVAYPAQAYFFAVAGCKLIRRIRSLCFEKLASMEVGWFDKPENSSGAIGARLSTDAAFVRALVGDKLGQLVQDGASAVSALIIAFVACWQLTIIILALLPLVALNGYVQTMFFSGFSSDAKAMYEDASQVATDAVGSIRTVASFCAEEKVIELYTKKCEGPKKTGIRQGVVSGTGFGISSGALFFVYAVSFYVGARFVAQGITTFEYVYRVFFALTFAAIGISQSSSVASDSYKARTAAASIFAILDRKTEIDPNEESGVTLPNVNGDIQLHHLSFTYPTRPDVQILRDLSLTIRSGKTVALVGESGSGKSTVIALLERFYDPNAGNITLDGVEIRTLQVKWLRQQMGLVSQEPALFNDTIRSNIAYGKGGDASEAEVIAAAEKANAHQFISGLQQGYDTVVGERGLQLSGGQKQRVAIARAIIKSPKILLLDEATSALDAESERVVQAALDQVMVNRTTVVVAHRLSTIKGADVIAVVKNGVVVERGKHEKLISIPDGFYAALVALHTSNARQEPN